MNKFTFFYVLFIAIMRGKGVGPLGVSMIIVAQELTKVICEPYTGALADKYGAGLVMAFGLVIRAIGFMIWLTVSSPTGFAFGIIVIGAGNACIIGKIDAFIYNTLLLHGRADKFRGILLAATIVENISSALIGGIISFTGGRDALLIFSVIFILFVHVPFVVFAIKDPPALQRRYTKNSPWNIIKAATSTIANDRGVLYLSFAAAMPASIVMLSADLYKMIIADLHIDRPELGFVYFLAHFLPIMASLAFLSVMTRTKKICPAHCIAIMLFGVSSYLAAWFFYGRYSVYIIVLFIGIVPVCNAALRDALESAISSDTRFTISSFVGLVTSACNVFFFLLTGILAKLFGYKTALLVFACAFSAIFMFLFMCANKVSFRSAK